MRPGLQLGDADHGVARLARDVILLAEEGLAVELRDGLLDEALGDGRQLWLDRLGGTLDQSGAQEGGAEEMEEDFHG